MGLNPDAITRWAAVCALIATATLASPASAEEGFDEVYTAARAAYDAGSFVEAARLLEQAYAIRPEPPLLFNMGKSLQKAGMYPEAIDAFRRYLDLAPPGERQEATEALIAVKAAWGKGWLTVHATPPEATIQIDYEDPIPPPVERRVLPSGTHWVTVTAPGMVSSRARVDLAAGEETVIDVDLQPAVPAAASEPAAARVSAAGSAPSGGMSTMEVGGWVSLGLGVAFAAGGATLLALGHADADEVDGADRDAAGVTVGVTRSEALDLADSAEWKSAAGIAGLATGGAGIITGIVLLVVAPEQAADQALWIAPRHRGGLALGGRF